MTVRKRLLCDVDEVLADFQTPMCEARFDLYGRRAHPEDCEGWDCFSIMTDYERRGVFATICRPGWCAGLQPKPGAQDAIQELRGICDVYAVTSHFAGAPTWVHERDAWLRDHFGFERRHIIHTSAKFMVKGDALLDDNPNHVRQWLAEHPGLGMLWHIPNTRKLGYDDIRVRSWAEVIERVGALP